MRDLLMRIGDAYQRFDPVALAANYTEDCVVDSPIGAGTRVTARIPCGS